MELIKFKEGKIKQEKNQIVLRFSSDRLIESESFLSLKLSLRRKIILQHFSLLGLAALEEIANKQTNTRLTGILLSYAIQCASHIFEVKNIVYSDL